MKNCLVGLLFCVLGAASFFALREQAFNRGGPDIWMYISLSRGFGLFLIAYGVAHLFKEVGAEKGPNRVDKHP